MATTNPSYYRSGGCHDIRQHEEHLFHLYMNQHLEGSPDGGNQKVVVNSRLPMLFGFVVANDWTIRDGPAPKANLVAHARGVHIGAGKADESWLLCHSILFTDTSRFKGSILKMLGNFAMDTNGVATDGEWAIIGGTGEFAYANGVVTAKIVENMHPTNGRI
ncbi:unnamed protein product [Urochloa decumbens]|uniref:Dirigent protein n=1 Tax=Urochloa decumbens TaxID=240449 RepID=A0ABC9B236_9POAL